MLPLLLRLRMIEITLLLIRRICMALSVTKKTNSSLIDVSTFSIVKRKMYGCSPILFNIIKHLFSTVDGVWCYKIYRLFCPIVTLVGDSLYL